MGSTYTQFIYKPKLSTILRTENQGGIPCRERGRVEMMYHGGEPGNQGLTLLQVGDDTPFPGLLPLLPVALSSNVRTIVASSEPLQFEPWFSAVSLSFETRK
jgi:hypothetical protein